MKSIAIILARGGSKRLPGKNLLEFNGRPMLAWTIQAALESQIFRRVVVSTDCEKISKVASEYGAEVPFLRSSASDDYSSSSEATLVALSQAECYWNESYSLVAQLMANCPLRSSSDILSAFKSFSESGSPSQISCFRYGWMNPWWAFRTDSKQRPDWLFSKTNRERSQDLPPLFCPTGAIWIARTKDLVTHRSFYMPDHTVYELPWMSSVDIDDHDDLEMARLFASRSGSFA